VRAMLGHREKRREVGRGPVKPEVGALPFTGAWEGMPGREGGKWPAAISLMPLMVGGLLRGYGVELKGGIKARSEDLAWHLEVGGRAMEGGRRR
jgi:hypothetical protein